METNLIDPVGQTLGKEFDTWQESYTAKMIGCVPHYLTLSRLLTQCLDYAFRPTSILDLGAGNGNSTAAASVLFPDAQFTLVEASENMTRDLKGRFGHLRHTSFQNQYMQDVSFPDESFDLILASFSLHHLNHTEKQDMIANIVRWLRPGGIFSYADLFVSKGDENHADFIQQWEAYVIENGSEGIWTDLKAHYDLYDKPDRLSDQISWLKKAGCNSIDVTPFDTFWIHLSAEK